MWEDLVDGLRWLLRVSAFTPPDLTLNCVTDQVNPRLPVIQQRIDLARRAFGQRQSDALGELFSSTHRHGWSIPTKLSQSGNFRMYESAHRKASNNIYTISRNHTYD